MTVSCIPNLTAQNRPLTCSLTLDCGQTVHDVAVGYKLFGRQGGPLIVVQGGISSTSQVCTTGEAQVGWWDEFVGRKKIIDTDKFRVLSIDYVDGQIDEAGCQPGEASVHNFHCVTTGDQARLLHKVVSSLRLGPIHAFVGSSYGGMVGLAYAERFPSDLERLVIISAAHEPHPLATGWRSLQRKIIRLGRDAGQLNQALEIARGLAMTTYRTADEFAGRFRGVGTLSSDGYRFPVDRYLEHHGRKFAADFDPTRFLCLSESIDLHRVAPSHIIAPTTLIGVTSDTLVPPWQTQQLAAQLSGPTDVHIIDSLYGHDAFLKEVQKIGAVIQNAISVQKEVL